MLKNLIRGGARALLAILALAAATVARQAPPIRRWSSASSTSAPIGEAGWTYQHELGRRALERALGPRVKTLFVEAVAEGPDSERVMRDLVAAQGARLVFATSFGYLEPALRVAAEFPAAKFEHAGGYKSAPNLATYDARYYEARWLAGWLAGQASRSGVAGYVAGFPVPEVVQGINAFTLGMRAAKPKAQVRVLWLDTWFDPARERDAAQALIDQGADVLTHHSGSPAVAQTAQANFRTKGVRVVPYPSDMRALRARGAARGDRASLGRLLHPRRRERARRHLEARADLGRHRQRHGRHRRRRPGPARGDPARPAEPAGGDRRRHAQALRRAAARQRRQSCGWRAAASTTRRSRRWTGSSRAWSGRCRSAR